MYSLVKDWRNKRNMVYETPHYSVENYFTEVHCKREMKHAFGDDLLSNLHLIPDPLKKNLADSIITCEEPKQKRNKNVLETKDCYSAVDTPPSPSQSVSPTMAPFSGITNFFSGVLSAITGAVSHLRPRSPANYYDCYDESNVSRQGSPQCWQDSKTEDKNKNERAYNLISNVQTELKSDMSKDVRSAAAQCEDRLNKVRLMLITKQVEAPKFRSRRPRKVFVEPGCVEEGFQDAFSPEDFVSLSNDPYIEYYSPYQYHSEELLETDSPRMRTEVAPVHETTEIVKTLPVIENSDGSATCIKSDNLDSESVKTSMSIVENECKNVNNSALDLNTVCVNERDKLDNEKTNSNCDTLRAGKISEYKSETEKTDSIVSNDTNKIPDEKLENKDTNIVPNNIKKIPIVELKEEVVSCEDKLSKLKALLQERRKNNKTITSSSSAPELTDQTNDMVRPSKTVPIEKSHDKRFKNPCRRTDKRKKSRMKKNINDDMLFAHEIHSDDLSSVENSPSLGSLEERLGKTIILSSVENSPSLGSLEERLGKTIMNKTNTNKCLTESPIGTSKISTPPSYPTKDIREYFDEISGKFHSTSATDSEDSFQIVFHDSPQTRQRQRLSSDCDSEDSFIVFEDSPDCYTSNDVFGDISEESDCSDTDSESDSGLPVTKLAHNLSRTISDLTDDSLYEDVKCSDEVDCAVRSVCEEIPDEDIVNVEEVEKSTGLLLTEAKKQQRKDRPAKKVQFSSRPPQVHVMRVWTFAARQARKGHWERYALDRDRFKRRIADVDMAVSWVLKPQHRARVMFQRFMPWWNHLKRIEIAEKKRLEEERKIAEEKEREERRIAEEKEREEKKIAERRAREEQLMAEEEEKERLRIEAEAANGEINADAIAIYNKINIKHKNHLNRRKTLKLEKLNRKIAKCSITDKKPKDLNETNDKNDTDTVNGINNSALDKVGDTKEKKCTNTNNDVNHMDKLGDTNIIQNGNISPVDTVKMPNDLNVINDKIEMNNETVAGT